MYGRLWKLYQRYVEDRFVFSTWYMYIVHLHYYILLMFRGIRLNNVCWDKHPTIYHWFYSLIPHHYLFNCYEISLLHIITVMFHFWSSQFSSSFIHRYRLHSYKRNKTDATNRTWTAHPTGTPDFISGFQNGACCSIFSFLYMLCRLFSVFVHFFFSVFVASFRRLTLLITLFALCIRLK